MVNGSIESGFDTMSARSWPARYATLSTILSLLVTLSLTGQAAEAAQLAPGALASPPTAVAARTGRPPRIDGDLSDSVWSLATPLGPLVQQSPDEGQPPTARTEIRILHDDVALYFGVRCFDAPGLVIANLSRRDRDVSSDAVVIDLDTRGDHRSAFHFEVSAAGVQRDALRTGDSALQFEWDAVWQSAVRRDDLGWSVTIAIPFSELRFASEGSPRFRLQVRRVVARRNEVDQWVPVGRDEHGELLRYGVLEGFAGLPRPIGVSLTPFVSARGRERRSNPTLGLPRGFDGGLGAGLDASIHLTSALTLNATALPEFGQVEADQSLLNLTTFEILFPEKRPFFLEGADLFSLEDVNGSPQSAQLFYSRRIGAAPASGLVPAGGSLLEQPELVRVHGAAKLSGRLADGIGLALLDAVTAPETALVTDGTTQQSQRVAALTNFFVGRLSLELGAGLRAGVMFAQVNRAESPRSMAVGGVCPGVEDPLGNFTVAPGGDGRCTHDATSGAVDLLWQIEDGGLAAGATLLASRLTSGPRRSLPDGVSIGPGDADLGFRFEASKSSGSLLGSLAYEGYGKRLDLNDAGYLRQQNLQRAVGRIAWRELAWGPTRESTFAAEVVEHRSFDGTKLRERFNVNNGTTWANSWQSWIEPQWFPVSYDNRETRDGALTERAAHWGLELGVSTNPKAPFSVALDSTTLATWQGVQLDAAVAFAARPHPRFEVSLMPSVTRLTGDPRWVGTAQDGTYRFGLQRALAAGVTLRSTFTFDQNLSLQAYAQLFFSSVRYDQISEAHADGGRTIALSAQQPSAIDPGAYDQRDAVLNTNVVLRWEFLPGSTFYLVYTRAHAGGLAPFLADGSGQRQPPPALDFGALTRGPIEDALLCKVSLRWAQ